MKGFSCSNCGNTVFFENVACLSCGRILGFEPGSLTMVALAENSDGGSLSAVGSNSTHVHYCANYATGVCNWLRPDTADAPFCVACSLNRTIPNLSEAGSLEAWHQLEKAKKRLVYSLLRFGLPIDTGLAGTGRLTFDFARGHMTGHLDGVITINVVETDAVERERQRQRFGEPYRSLLGHLRHESGHFYWLLLVAHAGRLDAFRDLFGNEQQDYAAALAGHHANPPLWHYSPDFLSGYASAHPWEDWAETWAHYLHMVDAVDTAEAMGFAAANAGPRVPAVQSAAIDAYQKATFEELMGRWVPLSIALNNLNRSIGHDDYYPFAITAKAREKLAFVHHVIHD